MHIRCCSGEPIALHDRPVRVWRGDTLPSRPGSSHLCPSLPYLPDLVRTMMALAQHLKDDSTAPTATASEGSLVRWECLLSSSNSCLWKVAASASRAIWGRRMGGRKEEWGVWEGWGLLPVILLLNTTAARRVIHTIVRHWQIMSKTPGRSVFEEIIIRIVSFKH